MIGHLQVHNEPSWSPFGPGIMWSDKIGQLEVHIFLLVKLILITCFFFNSLTGGGGGGELFDRGGELFDRGGENCFARGGRTVLTEGGELFDRGGELF